MIGVTENENFWCIQNDVIENLPKSYGVFVRGNLNGKVGTSMLNDVMGTFGIPRINNNGRRLTEMCNGRKLCVCNLFYKHKAYLGIQLFLQTKCILGYMKMEWGKRKAWLITCLLRRNWWSMFVIQDWVLVCIIVFCKVYVLETCLKRHSRSGGGEHRRRTYRSVVQCERRAWWSNMR